MQHKVVIATGHHISLVGSITPEELRANLDGISIVNGFANRLLYVWSRLTMRLPRGGDVDPVAVAEIADQVVAALGSLEARIAINGTVHLPLDPEADARWDRFYRERRTGIGEGVMKPLTARQVAHAARLSLIYAVVDGAVVIRREHLEAAIAWCDYSIGSKARAKAQAVARAVRAKEKQASKHRSKAIEDLNRPSKSVRTVSGGAFESNRRGH